MATDNGRDIIFTGSGDGELKAWRIDYDALAAGVQELESGEVRTLLSVYTSTFMSSGRRLGSQLVMVHAPLVTTLHLTIANAQVYPTNPHIVYPPGPRRLGKRELAIREATTGA